MTKENLNELKSLISRLNVENSTYGILYSMIDVHQYVKGAYSLTLRFDELMYSTDVADLMRLCFDFDILVSIHHYDDYCCLYFQ